jgi:hypothetical protein
MAAITAIRMAPILLWAFITKIATMVQRPRIEPAQFAWPAASAFPIAHKSRSGPEPSILKPNSFGSWLISTASAMPFM